MTVASYDHSVFINCPFDEDYRPFFEAITFAVHDCGYIARCAREGDDGSEVRIDKIANIIAACKFGIHDVSRTEPDSATGLPRFNMPLELGMFLGAKRFGHAEQAQKTCLILDVERYRFQKFIPDIAGQDIHSHDGDVSTSIKRVRDWLSNATRSSITIPGGAVIAARYQLFRDELPAMCEKLRLNLSELTFNNYVILVEEWLKLDSQLSAPA
jgi:hypothetical protein